MVQTLENIDKSKVYVDRIEGLDEVVSDVIGDTLIGAVSTITTSDLTAGKILVSDNNGKVAASNKTISDIGGDSDNLSITKNASDKLQTIGVINQNNTTTAIKTWTGTLAQYNAIATKDNNTLYNITDDMQAVTYEAYSKNETYNKNEINSLVANNLSTLLSNLYPVGSIYIGTQTTCPLAMLISGSTWVKVATSLVTDVSIPSTLTVCGNGRTLGLTNGNTWYGISFNTNPGWAVRLSTWQTGGATVGSSVSEAQTTVNKALGVVEGVQSGLIAKTDSITRTKITVNIWQRTA